MKKIFLFLLFIKIILGSVPKYFAIKRSEQYNFTLSNKNSSFYAYLTSEEDSEKDNENEDLDYKNYDLYFGYLKISKELGVKSLFRYLNQSFPDESEFNKTSSFESEYLEINDNIQLASYYKLYKKDNGMNLFVFYIKDEYLNSTMDNETFVFGRIGHPISINETILELELKPGEGKLFFPIFDWDENYDLYLPILFINHPFSVLYFGYNFGNKKEEENLYLYDIPYPFLKKSSLLVYNPENIIKKINFEYKIESNTIYREHRSINLKYNNSDIIPVVSECDPVIYIHSNENENILFNFIWKIRDDVDYWYLTRNISEIKNLEDLKKIENYKYITNRNIYTNNNYVFLLFYIWNYLELNASITNIEEKEQELDYFQFKYFKVSKGNILTFKKKYEENSIIIKLVSNNNGRVIINNIEYYFEEGKIEIINLYEKEYFTISSIDNNFIFAIKIKIPDNLICYKEFGKNYQLNENETDKFIVFQINYFDYSGLKFLSNGTFSFSIDVMNIDEIEKGAISKQDLFEVDLSTYNKSENLGKKCYLVLYYENLDLNSNIIIETKYYLPFPKEYDKYIILDKGDYMKYTYNNPNEIYYIVPFEKADFFYKYKNHAVGHGDSRPFSFSGEDYFNSKIMLINYNLSLFYIHIRKENETIYSFNPKCSSILEGFFLIPMAINKTHFRVHFPNLISDSPNINYTLIISKDSEENRELFNSKLSVINNFYFYKPNSSDDMDIYYFSLKDFNIVVNYSEKCELNNSVDLPLPKTIDFFAKYKPFIIKIIAEVISPYYIYFYDYLSFNLSICNYNCKTCDYVGFDDYQNCTSCKDDNKLLEEGRGNCVDKCSNGFYQNNNTVSVVLVPPVQCRPFFFGGALFRHGILQGNLAKNFLFKNARYLPCKIYNEKGGINKTFFLGKRF